MLKNYLITWKDNNGYIHNGLWNVKNIRELHEQFIIEVGSNVQILDIKEVN